MTHDPVDVESATIFCMYDNHASIELSQTYAAHLDSGWPSVTWPLAEVALALGWERRSSFGRLDWICPLHPEETP